MVDSNGEGAVETTTIRVPKAVHDKALADIQQLKGQLADSNQKLMKANVSINGLVDSIRVLTTLGR